MRGDSSKLIFIDSTVNTDGRDHSKILCPPHPFSASNGERMSLSLVSFTMRRNWYNINNTNNQFYMFVNNVYHQVLIAPGVYSTFNSLGDAIATALNLAVATVVEISSCSVSYEARNRLFTFQFAMAPGHTATVVEIQCFAIKSGVLPPGVTREGGFQDSHEIIGGAPTRSAGTPQPALTGFVAGGVNTLRSKYPASLNTLDAIYLHLNTVQTGNFMSSGYESHTLDSLRLIESSIFARIAFDDSTFTEAHEVVSFQDSGGDMFQTFIQRPNIESLDIRVTDARGRSLAQLNPAQASDGLLGFRACFRWDLFRAPPVVLPRMNYTLDHLPEL
jgi:hypothetical protein